ncbi:restriction endonuclease subunit S [Pseudoalteromonas sp. C8]|uniref:restriction endonuclease subunit S n=1 Tax=Pseudoalteromonas sp. C8 TaxID=2686345 RepID=UPI0013FE2C0C|nr:restriction endonuclease subunit S [Pseudoalteromonas sp. C8]
MTETKAPNTSAEQLITEHLDIWTTAIEQKSSAGRGSSKKFSLHGIKKLRELILELAVRGKLVPQDPNDEPASVLLERIADEKAQLVKDKKIKKPKALPEISEDEKPFELPKGWEFKRLGQLTLLENGDRSKNYPNKSLLVESGIPFVNAGHLISGRIAKGEMTFITDERFQLLRAGKFINDDILFCLRGSLGKSALVEGFESGAIASSLVIVRTEKALLPKYLLMYFDSPLSARTIKKYDNGTAQPNLSAADLAKFLVPTPSLTEQQRIVAKVDELMGLCDALEAQTENSITAHQTLVEVLLEALLKVPEQTATPEQATTQLQQNWQRLSEHFDTLFTTTASIDTLKQTILQLAVMGKLVPQNPVDEPAAKLLERIAAEKAQLIKDKKIKKQKPLPEITDEEKPFELPEGWEIIRLGEAFDVSSSKRIHVKDYVARGVPFFRSKEVGELGKGNEISTELFISEEQYNELKGMLGFPYPQDLMLASIGGSIGNNWIADDRPFYYKDGNITKISHHRLSNTYYLKIFIDSPFFWSQVTGGVSGSAYNALTIIKIQCLSFPLPPLEEQNRIVAKVDELITVCEQLKSRLIDAQTTKLHLTDAIVEQAL